MNAIATSWSDFCKDLSEAPKKLKRKELDRWLLHHLARRPNARFSIFEVTDKMHVAKAMTRLCHQGFIETIHDERDVFPWTYYRLHTKRTKPRPPKPLRCKTEPELFLEIENV